MIFKRAERKKAKLRLVLSGVSGSGKTFGALMLARGIGGRIALIDTEHKSAQLYSDVCEFDTLELEAPFSPERYIEAIHAAEAEGYDVLIIDSITHEWNGTGGVLEIIDSLAKSKFKGNSWAAWSEGTPRHRKFVEAMLGSNIHIIATIRTKAAYVETEDDRGKKTVKKLGTAPEQRDGMEYEFTTMLELSRDGNFAIASKDRTRIFGDPEVLTPETGKKLLNWLESGEDEPEEKRKKELVSYVREILIPKLGTTEKVIIGQIGGRALMSLSAKSLEKVASDLEKIYLSRQDFKKEQSTGAPVIRCEIGGEELTAAEIEKSDNRDNPILANGKRIKYACTKCERDNTAPTAEQAAGILGGTVVEEPSNQPIQIGVLPSDEGSEGDSNTETSGQPGGEA